MRHSWLRSMLGRKPKQVSDLRCDQIKMKLERAARLAIFGEIGGKAPSTHPIVQNCWGGAFVGKEGECAPIDAKTGNKMHPLLQVRVDTLPVLPEQLAGVALFNLWVDIEGHDFYDGQNGTGFMIREYASIDELLPIETKTSVRLPTFPISWQSPVRQPPSWEDIPFEMSKTETENTDWYDNNALVRSCDALQERFPIKIGGWPTWIQGAAQMEESTFVFQVDSSQKGRFDVGDSGSIYLFKTSSGWVAVSDCF